VTDEINRLKINLYLSGEVTICSNHRRKTENIRSISSSQRKGYSIKKSTRRNIISSAFFLFLKKQHEVIFLTLTFPYKVRPSQKINPFLNSWLTNMRQNYGLKNYIWTREDQKNGRPHYHLLLDIPYIPIKKINDSWCRAIGRYSPNAARLPKDRSIVKDIDRCTRYVSKYITKDQDNYFSERCYSISKQVQAKPIRLSWFDYRTVYYDHKPAMKFKVFDHCTTVKIWDFFKKSDYFIEFLGNGIENTEFSYCQEGALSKGECPKNQKLGVSSTSPGSQFSLFDST
jgi:hypothetical protein